ncbi:hypothetical protein [Chryseobacterium sp. FH1]|uniref:hypothetical protein n=1 Tax=Chryseobacterium sp. FH1 TaxID=1233951 RepID=UPI0004E2EEA1|nr:hypothetical protein [Chryseobacterium sp. FH1]KFC20423.1 hypothetical protein IO90_14800 [Chryseobacterium sp. FH1]
MLTEKLQNLKNELEAKLFLSDDDRKTLSILRLLDSDENLKRNLISGDILTKSFAVAPLYCPNCGKKN